MFTMKKSLLLLFFLGTISLSLCEEEKRYANEEAYEENVRDANVENGEDAEDLTDKFIGLMG
uniref:Andersonin-6 antimicrobial peptide n=1 Tax=Odorrana andersonii TaxID=369514 RepID=D2K8I6_ODOAN|nr:andersonin-6 antimicrobial peptide precursor [Odorrana andersonii]